MASIKVGNLSSRILVLPDQQSLEPGQSAVSDDSIMNHPVFASWVERGMASVEDARAEPERKRGRRAAVDADGDNLPATETAA